MILILVTGWASCFAEQLSYYRLVSITKNGKTITNVNGGQFVKFIGDICYECNNRGVGIGHGTSKLTSSDSQQVTYKGGSYLGRNTYFKFSADKSTLKLLNADASVVYSFVRSNAPSGVTTSSYIRSKNPPVKTDNKSVNYPSVVAPSAPNGSTSKRTQHKCTVCGGTGKVIRLHYAAGKEKWCDICRQVVSVGHRHEMCTYCYGKGYVEY